MKRALLRWLLFSPRRLLTITLIALVVLVGLVQLPGLLVAVNAPSSPPAGPTAAAAPPPLPAPATPAEPPSALTTERPAPGLPPREQARRFAQLWVDQGVDDQTWLARLAPLCTEEYGAVVLPQVDRVNIPATRVTGAPRLVAKSGGVAQVEVSLDHGVTILVELVDVTGAGAWRVSAVTDPDTRQV